MRTVAEVGHRGSENDALGDVLVGLLLALDPRHVVLLDEQVDASLDGSDAWSEILQLVDDLADQLLVHVGLAHLHDSNDRCLDSLLSIFRNVALRLLLVVLRLRLDWLVDVNASLLALEAVGRSKETNVIDPWS